jgi:hypothetical protein
MGWHISYVERYSVSEEYPAFIYHSEDAAHFSVMTVPLHLTICSIPEDYLHGSTVTI